MYRPWIAMKTWRINKSATNLMLVRPFLYAECQLHSKIWTTTMIIIIGSLVGVSQYSVHIPTSTALRWQLPMLFGESFSNVRQPCLAFSRKWPIAYRLHCVTLIAFLGWVNCNFLLSFFLLAVFVLYHIMVKYSLAYTGRRQPSGSSLKVIISRSFRGHSCRLTKAIHFINTGLSLSRRDSRSSIHCNCA